MQGLVIGRALITGGAGFIGGWLGAALAANGTPVTLVDNFARGRRDAFLGRLVSQSAVALHECDLATPGALADVGTEFTHVFHFAARVGVQNVIEAPAETLWANVALLQQALEAACRQRRLERFVFASSSEVYAGSLAEGRLPLPTPEDAPLAVPDLRLPRTSYMLSKIYGEAMVRHAGLPYTIVRPHNVYGPRMGRDHVVPQLLEKAHRARAGGRIDVYSVDHTRTFCFVDDAVEMIVAAATATPARDTVLNVGRESPEVAIGALADRIVRLLGKPLAIRARPATPGSPARRVPEMSRMRALAGYTAHIDLDEGLARTWAWYRDHAFGAAA